MIRYTFYLKEKGVKVRKETIEAEDMNGFNSKLRVFLNELRLKTGITYGHQLVAMDRISSNTKNQTETVVEKKDVEKTTSKIETETKSTASSRRSTSRKTNRKSNTKSSGKSDGDDAS